MVQKDPSYWLMKSEPDAYSIDTLKKEGVTLWDGIRNYQARNFMRKMAIGDKVFFYHSNCKPPGIVGFMEITQLNIVDPTQFQKESKYYDPKSNALSLADLRKKLTECHTSTIPAVLFLANYRL